MFPSSRRDKYTDLRAEGSQECVGEGEWSCDVRSETRKPFTGRFQRGGGGVGRPASKCHGMLLRDVLYDC